MVGFSAGVLISCVVFIVSYSQIPLANLATNLSVFTSSVVRPEDEAEVIRQHGEGTLIYRLGGYVFFGSATKIDGVFRTMKSTGDANPQGVIMDFTDVNGIDRSAISVFQRILRRYQDEQTKFYFVYSRNNESSLRSISLDLSDTDQIRYFSSLDHALESAEQNILAQHLGESVTATAFDYFGNDQDRGIFLEHCERRQVPKNEFLCLEREMSNALYFIESGCLEVIKQAQSGTSLRLAKLNPGAMVGEQAFYTSEARTASIAAAVDSTVYVLTNDALERLRTTHPHLATRFDHVVINKISRALARTSKLAAILR
jgi:SulP family sulfate permease